MRTMSALIAAALLLGGAEALAQKKKGPEEEGVKVGDTIYQKKTVYDFEDDVVEGNLVRPDGEYVAIRKGAKHSSLIKIRITFLPEMLKSAEDI